MYCVSDKFVALSLCVLCFEESVLCCQCVCVVFNVCCVLNLWDTVENTI